MYTATAETMGTQQWVDAQFWELVVADPDLLDLQFRETAAAAGVLEPPRRPVCRLSCRRPANRPRRTPRSVGPSPRPTDPAGRAVRGAWVERGPPEADRQPPTQGASRRWWPLAKRRTPSAIDH